MESAKLYDLIVEKEDLEILIRGCRRMAQHYKNSFAVADDPNDEAKHLMRFHRVDCLMQTISRMLVKIDMESDAEYAAQFSDDIDAENPKFADAEEEKNHDIE